MASIDADVVKHALKVAREQGFAEVEIANGEAHFRAALEPGPKVKKKPVEPVAPGEAAAPNELYIRANHVGYLTIQSGQLQVGSRVGIGDVVATISTLGLANEVESLVEGEIVEVLATDSDPVEYGQPIAKVTP